MIISNFTFLIIELKLLNKNLFLPVKRLRKALTPTFTGLLPPEKSKVGGPKKLCSSLSELEAEFERVS